MSNPTILLIVLGIVNLLIGICNRFANAKNHRELKNILKELDEIEEDKENNV